MGCGTNRSVRPLDLEPLTAWPQGWGGVKLKTTPLASRDFLELTGDKMSPHLQDHLAALCLGPRREEGSRWAWPDCQMTLPGSVSSSSLGWFSSVRGLVVRAMGWGDKKEGHLSRGLSHIWTALSGALR